MNLLKELKKYDNFLNFSRKLDGSIEIYRKSPFYRNNRYEVFTVQNQYIGSARWLLKRLCLMDNQRFDIVGFVKRKNIDIRNKREDRRIHEDIADFMTKDQIIL